MEELIKEKLLEIEEKENVRILLAMVRAKKYFYVLRPILACKWILEKGTLPPMLFKELMDAKLPKELKKEVNNLLDLKMKSSEIKLIPRVDKINEYLDRSIEEVKRVVINLNETKNSEWKTLNNIFLKELEKQY